MSKDKIETKEVAARNTNHKNLQAWLEEVQQHILDGWRVGSGDKRSTMFRLVPPRVVMVYGGKGHPVDGIEDYKGLKAWAEAAGSKLDFKRFKNPVAIRRELKKEFPHNMETGKLLIQEAAELEKLVKEKEAKEAKEAEEKAVEEKVEIKKPVQKQDSAVEEKNEESESSQESEKAEDKEDKK